MPVAIILLAAFSLMYSCDSSGHNTEDGGEATSVLHDPEVNVDIHREVPPNIQEKMWPEWFDRDLFPAHEDSFEMSEEQWREKLSRREYRVLRNEGTEAPFVNEYHGEEGEGIYVCRGCSAPLFSSETKFHSSSGWPSYFVPIELAFIGVKPDHGLLGERTEVHCARCGSHLGHVFEDGPEPTGLRYCMNSLAMRFIDEEVHEMISSARLEELEVSLIGS